MIDESKDHMSETNEKSQVNIYHNNILDFD